MTLFTWTIRHPSRIYKRCVWKRLEKASSKSWNPIRNDNNSSNNSDLSSSSSIYNSICTSNSNHSSNKNSSNNNSLNNDNSNKIAQIPEPLAIMVCPHNTISSPWVTTTLTSLSTFNAHYKHRILREDCFAIGIPLSRGYPKP